MFKKYKKIYILFSSLLLLCIVLLAGIGNYFINYALVSADRRGSEITPKAASCMLPEDVSTIKQNTEIIAQQKKLWLTQVKKEITSLISKDGLRLEADKFYQKYDTHKWALLVHGYGSNRERMQNIGSFYGLNGFHVVAPDMRAQGQSEGTYIGMGWLEKNDVLLWINQILNEDPDAQIVLHGVSMGAATVMMVSGESLPPQVKVIVEDCGYTSAWDIFSDELDYLYHLPPFPVLYSSSMMSSFRVGYDFKEASSLHQVAHSQTPILFIHGDQDTFVRPDMVHTLYDSASCEKKLLIIPGAGHNESYLKDPDTYFNTAFNFIGNYID